MIVIVDYGVGNLTSIMKMIRKSGHDAEISNDPQKIGSATSLILPGMGHFDHCMQKFNQSGLRELVTTKVMEERVPTLGICVGLQMFFHSSEEGTEPGLGWLPGRVIRFDEQRFSQKLSIPNMGWLDVSPVKGSAILDGLDNARFYFAHSYHVVTAEPGMDLMTAEYGYRFVASVEKQNLVGVQFHPEKSHRFGMRLLGNFGGLK